MCITFLEDNKVRLLTEKGREKDFEFDEVFGLDATQEQVLHDRISESTRQNRIFTFGVCPGVR